MLAKVLYCPEIWKYLLSCVWMCCQIYFYMHGTNMVEDWIWLCAVVPRGCLWINYQFSYHWLISIFVTLVPLSNTVFKFFLCSNGNSFSLSLQTPCGRNANWQAEEVCFMEAIMLCQVRGTNVTCMTLGHADLSSDRPWAYTHYSFSWILL